MSKLDDWVNESPERRAGVAAEFEKAAALEDLAARVAAAWQAYYTMAVAMRITRSCTLAFDTYRALADELEQATGQRVVCGRISEAKLTGRPV